MIKAIFARDVRGNLESFKITGHADAGPYGSDIVCSAVSAVSIGAVNGIESLAGFKPDVQTDTKNGGHLSLKLPEELTGEQFHIAQILLESLLLSMQSIAESYSEYVEIESQNSEVRG